MSPPTPNKSIDTFIKRWTAREGGAERANYQMFLTELCALIGVDKPDPAGAETELNDYVFERQVKFKMPNGQTFGGRIDLYKRGSFVLEAKQSRQKGGRKYVAGAPDVDLFGNKQDAKRGRRTADRGWDVLMLNARRQAEDYAKALPPEHGWPPFLLVCDVGHCIEVFADFTGQGKNYAQFPDRQGFRIFLEDLHNADVRERLAHVWTDPHTLDPTRKAAKVTREIAERLAQVSKSLEKRKYPAEDVALFLMRCLFTMFAEDVKLLPEDSFTGLLATCEKNPKALLPMLGELWKAMDKGGFSTSIETDVKIFNGNLFANAKVIPLDREEIGELKAAAKKDWREVEPAIFGALLEQALDPKERQRLGAHYTPRAYVERLVVATIMEPLRADWQQVLTTAERLKAEDGTEAAAKVVRKFHETLCATRVLDPACGTGNFLYVALELMKRLEGEVTEALLDLGGQEALIGLEGHTVDPHQFLGLELNPRAAAIAELVLWLGYLQWHLRTNAGMPAEPILRAFKNINFGKPGQGYDAVLEHDGFELAREAGGKPKTRSTGDGKEQEVGHYKNPHRPQWPVAEFIVGNPPFIGGKLLRSRLGDDYALALWKAHTQINESADFVMYWWDRAAEILTAKGTLLRRFGLVTTNSVTQEFSGRVIKSRMEKKTPLSLVMAIPDHPWTKATPDAAAVRIAMTVAAKGKQEGLLRETAREDALDTDTPVVGFKDRRGLINADLTVGEDVTGVAPLKANDGLCSPGVKLHGAGFIVTPQEAEHLGLGRRKGLDQHIRQYRNGRDLTAVPRGVMVIDLFGLQTDEIRKRFPEVYQHVLEAVKPERDRNNRATYRENWWVFGEARSDLRPALVGLKRYIATPVTQKHRTFEFLSGDVLPDDALMVVAIDDGFCLGVLHSRAFLIWFESNSSTLEDRPRFIKSRCFDPFPFSEADETLKAQICKVAEELDAFRKTQQAAHPGLTLTQMYNVREAIKEGRALDDDEEAIKKNGLILILNELHDKLDALVLRAYGWPESLSDEEVLSRLVALNAARAAEEKKGIVRWLRPDYQKGRVGVARAETEQIEAELVEGEEAEKKPAFPADPREQTGAVFAALLAAENFTDAKTLAQRFRDPKRTEAKINATFAALSRLGQTVSADGGKTFRLRHRIIP